MKIAVLAEGAWGTAIAMLLAYNGHEVTIWSYCTEVVEQINQLHENKRFLPGISLSTSLLATNSIDEAVCDAEWIFEAIPVQFLRKTIAQSKDFFKPHQKWVVLSKGIEQETLLFPSEIIADVLGKDTLIFVLAGPSFARDVAERKTTAVTVASIDCDHARELQAIVANDYFRPYLSTDMIGMQVGAAVKNLITLGIGMLEGAGYTDNTKAFLLTRGLHEIAQLTVLLGGKKETVYGLSGVGDLVLTSYGDLSKNLQVGRCFGAGETLDEILERTGYIPEGINTVQAIHQLIQRNNLSLPVCDAIYRVIFSRIALEDMIKELMAQSLSAECELTEK